MPGPVLSPSIIAALHETLQDQPSAEVHIPELQLTPDSRRVVNVVLPFSSTQGLFKGKASKDPHPPHHANLSLPVINAFVAITTWANKLKGSLAHLFCNNSTAGMVFQAGRVETLPSILC